MLKRDELTDPESCLSIARDDELIFVLLGRDRSAPVAIRAWAEDRIATGKNAPDDEQIREALEIAAAMDRGSVKSKQRRNRLSREEAKESWAEVAAQNGFDPEI